MQHTEIRIDERTCTEPQEHLELLAAVATALLEYQRRAPKLNPAVWRPVAKAQWRMMARWEQLQGQA